MEELFEKLLNEEILNEETQQVLRESVEQLIQEQVETARKEAKEQAEMEVRAELTKQYVEDKQALVEALDTKVEELLEGEIQQLREDIESFRDLEVEYAEKLVEAKQELAKNVRTDMEELVDALDTFVEMRLSDELEELKESIDEARKNEFGQAIFESLEQTFRSKFVREDETHAMLESVKAELAEKEETLKKLEEAVQEKERNMLMEKLLSDLDGKPRVIMEAILDNTPTEKLESAYENFIGRVLHESVKTESEMEAEVHSDNNAEEGSETLTESKDEDGAVNLLEEGKLVTGDAGEEELTESANQEEVSEKAIALKRLAGVIN